MAGCGCQDNLFDHGLSLLRMLFQISRKSFADSHFHSTYYLLVAKFGLCLTFELRFEHLNRDNCGKAFAEVIGVDFHLHLLEHLGIFGIFAESSAKAAAETGEVSTAFIGVDVVNEREHVFVESGVVGHSHFHRYSLLLGRDVYNVVDKRFFARIDVTNEIVKTSF